MSTPAQGPWTKYAQQQGPWTKYQTSPQPAYTGSPAEAIASGASPENIFSATANQAKQVTNTPVTKAPTNAFGFPANEWDTQGNPIYGWVSAKDKTNLNPGPVQIDPRKFLGTVGAGGVASAAGLLGEAGLPFLRGLLPSTANAGEKFQQVMSVAKNNPVNTSNDLSAALSNYQKLVDAGGSRSMSVSKLLNRLTDPSKGPLTYEEARNFSHNISRLSADEAGRLTPVMKRAVGQVASALGDTVQATADAAGQGQNYSGAMGEYAKAKRLEDIWDKVKDTGVDAAMRYLPWAGIYFGGKKLLQSR